MKSFLHRLVLVCLFSCVGKALDILNQPPCQNLPPSNLKKEVAYLQEISMFPRRPREISSLARQCSMRVQNNLPYINTTYTMIFPSSNKDMPRPLDLANRLTQQIEALVKNDLDRFRESHNKTSQCLQVLRKKPETRTLSEDCRQVIEKMIPMLNERLQLMRIYLFAHHLKGSSSAASGRPPPPMHHLIFESQQKKDPKLAENLSLDPLNDEELRLLAENPDVLIDSRRNYEALISQSPVLLYFKGPRVTMTELEKAFEHSHPAKFGKSAKFVDHDYILFDDYLIEVLKKLPKEDIADACLVASELRKNYQRETEFRELADWASIAFSTVVFWRLNPAGIAGTAAFSGLSSVANLNQSRIAKNHLTRSLDLCLQSKYSPDGYRNSLCSFQDLRSHAQNVERSWFYLPIFGSPAILSQLRQSKQ
jgi:hypothetical protein